AVREIKGRGGGVGWGGVGGPGKDGTRQSRGFERADFFRRTVKDGNSSEGTLLIGHALELAVCRAGPPLAPEIGTSLRIIGAEFATHKEYLPVRSALGCSTDSAGVCDRFSRSGSQRRTQRVR